MRRRVGILISGRGSNMAAILREARCGMLRDCCEPVVVVSNRAQAPGLVTAREAGVETVVVPSRGQDRDAYDLMLLDALRPHRLDYVVLAGFMRLLGPATIRRFRDRIVNIHPADPRLFKGIGGYEWAWRQALATTTITVHLVDEGMDTGRIVASTTVSLEGAASLEEVERRGLAVEHEFYSRVLRDLFTANTGSAHDTVNHQP